jgi:peptidoglycan/LPS O-acetylase OafA/YrhL
MIQRKQTIWMLFAAVAIFLTLGLSFYSGTLISDGAFHSIVAKDNYLLMILTCALGTTLLVNIFLYKHRGIQFRIAIFALFAECIIIFIYMRQINDYSKGNFNLWAALHIFIFVFIIMAAVAIYKDEKLVKDSNRLR